ncbi:putative FMN-dependent luciferase-like monooxygenase [Nonomuraea gerenzanensis]|uniref:Alkanal monooxygenase alpha chain n=1 Tax=Nonomuraea gerenzanensis TaxID=93944 RepID=A0A1M4ED29_9ACTN|nr:putative FMN-dependent luciferase-like monooxygenase [Nonomuraea gerenzanensis]UBU08336.1 putative FMN-dependent luciferase-like monooxygenase [Nonomuraea gerenzanensis]SBO96672.1 Alkanal monooxygenase alpha chain [Nonomuraea gerenzanensis]
MRLGFFTRLLDDAPPGERYRLAAEQIRHAEAHGFDTAWVAQHHFDGEEGGLPAPLVFLAHVAATTRHIRLGTGIITLPLEHPLRVAEDTAVLDLLAGGRLEVGVGGGGTPSAFGPFGHDAADRAALYAEHLWALRRAWAGEDLGGGNRLYPPAPRLLDAVWEATFSVAGGARAGRAGHGLMLSRTQPRPAEQPQATLADLQLPIVEAYHESLPPGATPRIMASRTAFVADSRADALRHAEIGLGRRRLPFELPVSDLDSRITAFDVHLGTPQDVIESLRADPTLQSATDLVFQVHSVDPPHPLVLRSIELLATEVAPAFGWRPSVELSKK